MDQVGSATRYMFILATKLGTGMTQNGWFSLTASNDRVLYAFRRAEIFSNVTIVIDVNEDGFMVASAELE